MAISLISTPFDHFQLRLTLAVNPNLILEPCHTDFTISTESLTSTDSPLMLYWSASDLLCAGAPIRSQIWDQVPDPKWDQVPGPNWDQGAKKVPKKSLFCLQVPKISFISINERIASI